MGRHGEQQPGEAHEAVVKGAAARDAVAKQKAAAAEEAAATIGALSQQAAAKATAGNGAATRAAGGNGATARTGPAGEGRGGAGPDGPPDVAHLEGARQGALPARLEPELATLVAEAPAGVEQVHSADPGIAGRRQVRLPCHFGRMPFAAGGQGFEKVWRNNGIRVNAHDPLAVGQLNATVPCRGDAEPHLALKDDGKGVALR